MNWRGALNAYLVSPNVVILNRSPFTVFHLKKKHKSKTNCLCPSH